MKNLLRIKINGKPVIKLCQSSHGEDFYCYFPSLIQDKNTIGVHFSFHSRTGRVTFKTTSLRNNGEELLPKILETIKEHPHYNKAVTPKDLDLYKGKMITFVDNLTFYPWFQFALNLKNSNVTEYIGKTKTVDVDFPNVLDVRVEPPRNKEVTIKGFIGKNITRIPDKKDKEYDLLFSVTELNFAGEKYTFVFCLSYDFPKIEDRSVSS